MKDKNVLQLLNIRDALKEINYVIRNIYNTKNILLMRKEN